MSKTVNLPDDLVQNARLAGRVQGRSAAEQVEFWSRLGCAIEQLIGGEDALALRKRDSVRPVSNCLESVDTREGRRRVAEYLETQPYPHYKSHPSKEGLLVRIDANGKRSVGRFVNRKFQPVSARIGRR